MLQYKRTEKNHFIGWWPVVVSLFLIFILAGCGSEETSEEVLTAWSIEPKNVGPFNLKQREYLNYHRENVLKA